MKRKTKGIDPKVPVQAVVAAIVAVLAYFGFDIDPAISGVIATVLGLIAGYFAPAPQTVPANSVAHVESGPGAGV